MIKVPNVARDPQMADIIKSCSAAANTTDFSTCTHSIRASNYCQLQRVSPTKRAKRGRKKGSGTRMKHGREKNMKKKDKGIHKNRSLRFFFEGYRSDRGTSGC